MDKVMRTLSFRDIVYTGMLIVSLSSGYFNLKGDVRVINTRLDSASEQFYRIENQLTRIIDRLEGKVDR